MNPDNLLVATKFSPPRISPRHIPREHLLTRLRDTKYCAATLITGGAGFGKTISAGAMAAGADEDGHRRHMAVAQP
ncbi:hypothetical protein ACU4HD_10465 [Cupriavidus basilensis]